MTIKQLKEEITKVALINFEIDLKSRKVEDLKKIRTLIDTASQNVKGGVIDPNKSLSKFSKTELELLFAFLSIEANQNNKTTKLLKDFPKLKKEPWQDYYERLLELGFKKTTLQKQITEWKQQHKNVPSLSKELTKEINLESDRHRQYKASFNCTIKEENYLFFIEQLETKSRTFENKLLYILACTGRRQSEPLEINAFTFKDKTKKIIFNNQLKTKSKEVTSYEIPYLGNYETIKMFHHEIIEELKTKQYKSNHIRSMVHKAFEKAKASFQATIPGLLKAHNLRALYLLYIHNNYNNFFTGAPINITNLDKKLLGHSSDSEIVNYLSQVILSKEETNTFIPFLNVYGGTFEDIENKVLNDITTYSLVVPHLEEIRTLLKEVYAQERNTFKVIPSIKKLSYKKKALIKELLTLR